MPESLFNKVAGLRPATLLKKETLAQACDFITKEILAQVFSCEFCKIFRNILFYNASGGCFCVLTAITPIIKFSTKITRDLKIKNCIKFQLANYSI